MFLHFAREETGATEPRKSDAPSGPTSFPRPGILPSPGASEDSLSSLSPGGGKIRNPGKEVALPHAC